jgi:hypothetical protein
MEATLNPAAKSVQKPAAAPPAPRLPRTVMQLLEWLDPKDYGKVETLICSMPSTKEVVLVARFLDQVWNQARNAEYRIGASRITGAEMDEYYDRWKASLLELMKIGIELSRRAGLTEILQKHKRVLAHFGYETSGRVSGGGMPPASPAGKAPKPAAAAVSPAA